MSAIELLQSEVARMKRDADAIRKQIDERQMALYVVEQSTKAIEAVLAKVACEAGVDVAPAKAVSMGTLTDGPRPDLSYPLLGDSTKPKPAVAVMALLNEHPDGIALKDVVLRLEDNINSESTDKRRLLYSTVHSLRMRGKISQEKDAAGNDIVKAIRTVA